MLQYPRVCDEVEFSTVRRVSTQSGSFRHGCSAKTLQDYLLRVAFICCARILGQRFRYQVLSVKRNFIIIHDRMGIIAKVTNIAVTLDNSASRNSSVHPSVSPDKRFNRHQTLVC